MADTSILQDRQDQSRTRIAASPDYAGATGEVERYATKLQETSPVPRLKSDVEAKTKELFDFDRQMEGNYDPLAQQRTGMYGAGVVGNPATTERYATGAYGAGAGFASDLLGAVGKYQSLETSALGQILNSVLSVIERQERAKEKEQENIWKSSQTALEITKLTGGQWTDPVTGKTYNVPAPKETTGTATERAQVSALDALKRDVQRGVPFYELWPRYKNRLEEWQIREEYNKGSMARPVEQGGWGPAKETSAGLQVKATTLDKWESQQQDYMAYQKAIRDINALDIKKKEKQQRLDEASRRYRDKWGYEKEEEEEEPVPSLWERIGLK